ncbi:hypothetical protein AGMMS49545_02270 [Betaproteobacteria bacterium]|nr:hypothetical protein AGMMS49545_02270 [Betaproteobacteria bacterium]GHU43796.1 hypothetical protein AGMMS50289_10840 [Betaproteobacteria bacterium]
MIGTAVRHRNPYEARRLGRGKVADVWEDADGEHVMVFWTKYVNQFQREKLKRTLERRDDLIFEEAEK